MKNKITFLCKTLVLLLTFFFVGNVYAFDFGNKMTKDNYGVTSTNNYTYVLPVYSQNSKDKLNVTGGQSYLTEQLQPDTGVKGTGAKFIIDFENNNGGEKNISDMSVRFNGIYKMNGQKVDALVTINKFKSNVKNNEVRIYVNETTEHRYLGFSIYNSNNVTTLPSGDIEDMLDITINLYNADTNTPYTNEKNKDIILYYNDIDADPRTNQHELAKLININSKNIYLASQDSRLKINSDNIISSYFNNSADGGWEAKDTKKVSLIVKGDPNLQNNGTIKLGLGHIIPKNVYVSEAGAVRFGGTDVQFFVPPTITGEKTYASDTPNGIGKSMVVVNDIIKYNINLKPDTTWKEAVTTTITDTLSQGLEYVEDKSNEYQPKKVTKNNDGTTTLTWEIGLNKETNLTYKVKVVNGYKDNKVSNIAVAKIGSKTYQLGNLENPIPTKAYASDTPNGKDGAKVEKGNVIKYSITYKNTSSNKEKIKITDTLSKGIKYKKNSAKMGNTELEPKVTENEDGTTTLIWEKEVAANTEENLTYSVDVVGGVSEVRNKAYLQYAKLKSGSTTEYDDYSEKTFLNELINPLDVEVPNTGATSSIILIIIGLMSITSGLVIIKKKTKKALN